MGSVEDGQWRGGEWACGWIEDGHPSRANSGSPSTRAMRRAGRGGWGLDPLGGGAKVRAPSDEHSPAGERAGKTKRNPAVGPHEEARGGEAREKGSHGTPPGRTACGGTRSFVCAVRVDRAGPPLIAGRVFHRAGAGPFAQAGVPLCVSGGSPFGGLARPAGVPLRVASRGPSRGGGVGGESRPVRGSAPTGAPDAHSGGVRSPKG